jgi:hypothetical protein
MKYEDLRSTIRTGDLLACHGREWTSDIIEFFTGKSDKTSWSHMALFYWSGDGLWIAQEYEGVGFGCYPASQLIASFIKEKSTCYLAAAPAQITDNSPKILNFIQTYRVTPHLKPYGYGSLIRILLDDKTDPDSVQAVCSIFDQQSWEACGYKFNRLFAPEDFKSVVTNIVEID